MLSATGKQILIRLATQQHSKLHDPFVEWYGADACLRFGRGNDKTRAILFGVKPTHGLIDVQQLAVKVDIGPFESA